MGQAFDRDGNVLGEAFGESKREVFNKRMRDHVDAAELRIRSLSPAAGVPDAAFVEMPRYHSHKDVWALKIAAIGAPAPDRDDDGSRLLHFEEPGYGARRVSAAYIRKHDPQPGGYFVVYKDGYESFSPAQAFEEGYTRV